jgi:hypothetical protein
MLPYMPRGSAGRNLQKAVPFPPTFRLPLHHFPTAMPASSETSSRFALATRAEQEK